MSHVVWPYECVGGPRVPHKLQGLPRSRSHRITQGHLGRIQTRCPPAVKNIIAFFKQRGFDLSEYSSDLNALLGGVKVICTHIPSWDTLLKRSLWFKASSALSGTRHFMFPSRVNRLYVLGYCTRPNWNYLFCVCVCVCVCMWLCLDTCHCRHSTWGLVSAEVLLNDELQQGAEPKDQLVHVCGSRRRSSPGEPECVWGETDMKLYEKRRYIDWKGLFWWGQWTNKKN